MNTINAKVSTELNEQNEYTVTGTQIGTKFGMDFNLVGGGENAVTYITNTTPVTGLSARQVVCLTDTVFSTFTRTNSTGSLAGISLPAGTLLIGTVTAITLTSGAVAAYA